MLRFIKHYKSKYILFIQRVMLSILTTHFRFTEIVKQNPELIKKTANFFVSSYFLERKLEM